MLHGKFVQNITMIHKYKISGMTCSSCAEIVKKLLSKVQGIDNVELDQTTSIAQLSMKFHIPVNSLQNGLGGTKYSISELNHYQKSISIMASGEEAVSLKTYLPIYLIFLYITTTVAITQFQSQFNLLEAMRHFMAGFFIVFSFFKMLDLKAFASSYRSYDIIAKRLYGYGYAYPFIELAIGFSFLFSAIHFWSNLVTLIIMGVSVIGVIQSILRKNNFQCACLGTVFKLPLSKITLFEDGLMIIMSLISLTILK